jgi:hypothetical protein
VHGRGARGRRPVLIAHLNQEKDTLHAELSDLDGSLRREREKQSQLK